MAITLDQIKSWFLTGKKPSQQQYHAMLDYLAGGSSIVLPHLDVRISNSQHGYYDTYNKPIFVQCAINGDESWLSLNPRIVLLRRKSAKRENPKPGEKKRNKKKWTEPGPLVNDDVRQPEWITEFLSNNRDFIYNLQTNTGYYNPRLVSNPATYMSVDNLILSFIRVTDSVSYSLYGNRKKRISTGDLNKIITQRFGLCIRVDNPNFAYNAEYPHSTYYKKQSKYLYGPVTPLFFGLKCTHDGKIIHFVNA
ncbi:MAG: hypothetical protein RBS07_15725 [Lentimicrobium sp.]|jgi:hypothetical protein|nr:hypothetical protein [Lentimicrobium sp.]